MAKGGISLTAIEETQQLIKKPCAKVPEEKKRAVEFSGHKKVKATIARNLAMFRENQMDGCLPCQNGTAKNPPTRWRRKGVGAPPPELVPPLSGMPPAPPGCNEGASRSEIDSVPPGYVYINTPLPNTRFFNLDSYAKDHKCDQDVIPALLTAEGTSTG